MGSIMCLGVGAGGIVQVTNIIGGSNTSRDRDKTCFNEIKAKLHQKVSFKFYSIELFIVMTLETLKKG